LKALGVIIEVPTQPFPRFSCDEAKKKHGRGYEVKIGEGDQRAVLLDYRTLEGEL